MRQGIPSDQPVSTDGALGTTQDYLHSRSDTLLDHRDLTRRGIRFPPNICGENEHRPRRESAGGWLELTTDDLPNRLSTRALLGLTNAKRPRNYCGSFRPSDECSAQ